CPEPPDLRLAEDVVTGEELVRALTGQHDLQSVFVDSRRQSQQRRRGGPKRGLLGKGDGSRQQLGDVRRVDRHPRQLRADLLDEPILVRALVETGITEADRVGRQAGDQLAGERRGGGRVEPTADVDAYRNVRAEPETRRLPEELAQLLGLLAGGSFGLV